MTSATSLRQAGAGTPNCRMVIPAAGRRRGGYRGCLMERLAREQPTGQAPESARSRPAVPGQLLTCARRLDRPLGWLPASHLSLVVAYSNSRDDWREYEGAPTRAVPGAYGPIVVHTRPYRPRLDRVYLTVAVRKYDNLWAIAADMDAILERLNLAEAPYEPLLGPNSNTVVRRFLLE